MQGGIMDSDSDGLWIVTRHEDIKYVSQRPELFCSGQGVQFEDVPDDLLEASHSFLAMDAPRHQKLRRLVSTAFTPKQVRKIDDQIQRQAARIVDDLVRTGEGDFVDLVSKRLPMWTVYEMLGLDASLRAEAARLADEAVGFNDAELLGDAEPGEMLSNAIVGLLAMALDFIEHRRAHPADDLMTNLVNAEVDGERLSDDDIAAFFVLISVAGNDTTRNTISMTTHALQQHGAQREWLLADYEHRIAGATEEFVRWASPVMTFRRTATTETTLGAGEHEVTVAPGQWVALMYASGNRDERVFDAPGVFDLSRNPNPHVGFGGGGPHFCMGNFVAKMQLRHLFDELLHRVPTLEVDEPEYLVGNFVRAVKRMPCRIR